MDKLERNSPKDIFENIPVSLKILFFTYLSMCGLISTMLFAGSMSAESKLEKLFITLNNDDPAKFFTLLNELDIDVPEESINILTSSELIKFIVMLDREGNGGTDGYLTVTDNMQQTFTVINMNNPTPEESDAHAFRYSNITGLNLVLRNTQYTDTNCQLTHEYELAVSLSNNGTFESNEALNYYSILTTDNDQLLINNRNIAHEGKYVFYQGELYNSTEDLPANLNPDMNTCLDSYKAEG